MGPLSLIVGEAVDAVSVNEDEGGVGLAKRSAIKITGVSRKGQESEAQDLIRYESMKELDISSAKSILEKSGCSVLCSGVGDELYKDPGTSNRYADKLVLLAPSEAVKAALASAASKISVGEAKTVAFNFLGGDDLVMGEVLDACDVLVNELDIPDKTKVTFNSMSFTDFKEGRCSLTVVASDGQTSGSKGADASVAKGELYIYDGKWYTVAEGDITTAIV